MGIHLHRCVNYWRDKFRKKSDLKRGVKWSAVQLHGQIKEKVQKELSFK